MLQWLKDRLMTARRHADARPERPQQRAMSGEYLPLHEYLENRFANVVVLKFAEIEDLLGFKLPDVARLRQDWWTNATSATASAYSDSWLLSGRTATPNLLAQTVFFERGI
jgi:hypothetical protein